MQELANVVEVVALARQGEAEALFLLCWLGIGASILWLLPIALLRQMFWGTSPTPSPIIKGLILPKTSPFGES